MNKKIIKLIIGVLVLIALVIALWVGNALYKKNQVKNFLKSELSDYEVDLKLKGVDSCRSTNCVFSLDSSCFSYEKIPGCSEYIYEGTFDNGDSFNFSVYYEKNQGTTENNIRTVLDDYKLFKNKAKRLFDSDDFTIKHTLRRKGDTYEFHIQENLSNNLNKEFVEGLISYYNLGKMSDKRSLAFDFYFLDKFKISTTTSGLEVYYDYPYNHSYDVQYDYLNNSTSIYLDVYDEKKVERTLESLKSWVLKHS